MNHAPSLIPIYLTEGVQTLVLLAIAWRGLRVLNRIYDILKDYPPHRHVNDKIIYPRDYEPGEVHHGQP